MVKNDNTDSYLNVDVTGRGRNASLWASCSWDPRSRASLSVTTLLGFSWKQKLRPLLRPAAVEALSQHMLSAGQGRWQQEADSQASAWEVFKVTVLVACVSCALNSSEFCIMGNMGNSTFFFFYLPNSTEDIKSATFFYVAEIVIPEYLLNLSLLWLKM